MPDQQRSLLHRFAGSTAAWIVAAVALLTAFMAWGLSSPIGASPDDDYHLASIWCASGGANGLCDEGAEPDSRQIPLALHLSSHCFAGQADQSAACQLGDFSHLDEAPLHDTDRGNFDGIYPPVFYAVMGMFSGADANVSVVAMRFFNGFLFVAALGALVALVRPERRTLVVVPVVVTLVPFGMFLIPSINGSSWALLSAALVFPALHEHLRSSPGRRSIGLLVLAVLGVLIGAGARADAAAYAGFAVVLASLFAWRDIRRSPRRAIAPAAMLILAGIFYLFSGQASALSDGLGEGAGPAGLAGALSIALDIPALWTGMFGAAGLGWLDTPLPGMVPVLGFAVFVVIIARGLRAPKGLRLAGFVMAMAALYLVPLILQVQSNAPVGSEVQPRYILPLATITAAAAIAAVLGLREGRLGRVEWIALVVVLSATNAVSLQQNIRRYVTGLDVKGVNLDAGIEWWWPLAPSPMTVWIMGSAAFAIALAVLALKLSSGSGTGMTISDGRGKGGPRQGVDTGRA